MAGLEDLLNPTSNSLHGASVDGQDIDAQFIDADTIQSADGQKFRLQGLDAPEVYHDQAGAGQEVGAVKTTEEVVKLANSMGFNKIVIQDQGSDNYGRQVADLVNKDGQSFRHMLASTGVMQPHVGFDETGLGFSAAFGRATRDTTKPDTWELARQAIDSTIEQQQKRGAQFKANQLASGEWGLYRDAKYDELSLIHISEPTRPY